MIGGKVIKFDVVWGFGYPDSILNL